MNASKLIRTPGSRRESFTPPAGHARSGVWIAGAGGGPASGGETPRGHDDGDGERSTERPARDDVGEPVYAEHEAAETDNRDKEQARPDQQETVSIGGERS